MSPDPMMLAIEHIAWCVRDGMTLAELHNALGAKAGPRWHCWEDAIARLTRIASDMLLATDALAAAIEDKRRELGVARIELEALERAAALRPTPFRRREPPRSAAWPARGAA